MEHADRIRLNVLGGLDALGSDGHPLRFPTRHCGFVLAMLAATPQHRLRREAIAGRLWSERGESQARASLRQTIHHLQKALRDAGCPALEVERDNLALLPPYVSCDLWELQHVLKNNPEALGDLHTGEFLASYGRADPAFDEWVAATRHSLTADVGTALRSLASEEKHAGRHADLERSTNLLLRLDPYDEDAFRLHLEALAGQDRRGALQTAHADFKARLQRDLGTDVAAETSVLFETLVEEPRPAAPKTKPETLSRQSDRPEVKLTVSVLTAIAEMESTDPELMREAILTTRAAVESAVQTEEAELLPVAGDTINVVFGGSVGSEAHAENAVRCAWQLLRKGPGPFRGLGVATGDVILSKGGLEPTSAGVLQGHAAQLARMASQGSINIADATARRIEGFFEFDRMPNSIGYVVTAETAARNRWQARGGVGRGAFIARGLQMAELERAAGRASDGDGRVVGIVGEAGIGKSRLVDEFLHSDATASFQVMTLSATANDKSTPFGPLRDFLADWAGRPAPGTPLADTLFDTAREQGIAAEHLPALRALAGATSANGEWDRWDGPVRRRRIVALIRTIVDTSCRKAPLILVVEDLHWLDGETEQLLQALVDDLATLPLLMITTYRPDYAAEFVGRSVFHLVRLEPLSSSETRELVECLIGPDPELADVRRRITERTGGIPLFIEESVSALAGSGALVGPRGQYETGSVSSELPATIQDVLSARISQLSDDARWLIQCASVFGSEVEEPLLTICGGLGVEQSNNALAELLQAELLVRRRRGEEKVLRFRHALIEDVTYAGLLNADRKRLHGEIYRLLNADDAALTRERCSSLARHADRHGDNVAAANWYERSGDMFAEISAYAQATVAYQSALDAIASIDRPEAAVEIDIRLKLRPVLVPQGRFGAAIAQLEAAEDLLADSRDRRKSASILISKSYIHSTSGDLTDAADEARRAAQLTRKGEQPDFEARLALGQSLSLSGAWQETLNILEPTLDFWEEHRHERFGHTGTRSIWCHGHIAHAHAIHGAFDAALDHAEEGSRIASETGRPLDRVFADHRRGEILLVSGQFEQATALFENAFAVANTEAEDAPIFRTWFACDQAPAYLASGRLEDAAAVLAVQHENAKRMELKQFGAWIVLRKAELALAEGHPDAATALAEEALTIARRLGDLLLETTALRVSGIADRALGGSGDALSMAASLAESRGFVPELEACREASTSASQS